MVTFGSCTVGICGILPLILNIFVILKYGDVYFLWSKFEEGKDFIQKIDYKLDLLVISAERMNMGEEKLL